MKCGKYEGKEYALKVVEMDPELKDFNISILKEAITNANLNSTSLICTYFYWIEFKELKFSTLSLNLLMDCADESLTNWLKLNDTSKKENIELCLKRLTHVMIGLEYLHSNQTIHRDLKPANLLLHNGVLKITDFGLSTLRKTRYDKKSLNALNKTNAGSEFYRAPELDSLKGGYDSKVDIYSMGIILMECLANFQNDKNAKENALQRMQENCHLSDDIKRNLLLEIFRQSRVNNVRNCEVDLILHMTNPNPANRPTALQANNKILCIYSSKNLNSKYGLDLDEDILCKLNGIFLTTISTSQSPIRSLNEDNYDKPENTLKLETLIKQDEFKRVVKRDYFNSESDVHKIIRFKAEGEDIEKARDKPRNDYAKVANELANMKIMSAKHVNILEFMRKLDQSQLAITVVMPICIKSLADLLKETKNVRIRDFSVGCKLFKDISYGIWYLHRLKYIHHNLKPSNILLGSDSKWKISDYGLPSLKATNGFESEVEYYLCQITSGEPCYAAPEQLGQIDESEMETSIKVKQDSEFKIDIFSFACVCIEYLTHFDDETNISLAAALNSIRDEHILPDDLLHGEFAELIQTFYDCTHKKASKRPDSLQVISMLYEFFELKNPSLYQEILNE